MMRRFGQTVTVETPTLFDPAEVDIWIEAIRARSASVGGSIEEAYAYYLSTNKENSPQSVPNIEEAGKRLGIGKVSGSAKTVILAALAAVAGIYFLTR